MPRMKGEEYLEAKELILKHIKSMPFPENKTVQRGIQKFVDKLGRDIKSQRATIEYYRSKYQERDDARKTEVDKLTREQKLDALGKAPVPKVIKNYLNRVK